MQLRFAEQRPQNVHVARSLLGREVRELLATLGLAPVGEHLPTGNEGLLLSGIVRRRVHPQERVELLVADAVERV